MNTSYNIKHVISVQEMKEHNILNSCGRISKVLHILIQDDKYYLLMDCHICGIAIYDIDRKNFCFKYKKAPGMEVLCNFSGLSSNKRIFACKDTDWNILIFKIQKLKLILIHKFEILRFAEILFVGNNFLYLYDWNQQKLIYYSINELKIVFKIHYSILSAKFYQNKIIFIGDNRKEIKIYDSLTRRIIRIKQFLDSTICENQLNQGTNYLFMTYLTQQIYMKMELWTMESLISLKKKPLQSGSIYRNLEYDRYCTYAYESTGTLFFKFHDFSYNCQETLWIYHFSSGNCIYSIKSDYTFEFQKSKKLSYICSDNLKFFVISGRQIQILEATK